MASSETWKADDSLRKRACVSVKSSAVVVTDAPTDFSAPLRSVQSMALASHLVDEKKKPNAHFGARID
jgi:hypothetical protein